MRIQLKLFSIAKDLAGSSGFELELEHPAAASVIFEKLIERNPQFRNWKPSLRLAVNQEYVRDDHPVREGDEVAVIPPVSGG